MSTEDISALASPPEEDFIVEPIVDIFVSEENKQALLDYLSTEVDEVASDSGRKVRLDRNDIIKRQRLARPESETKDFPWENASNVTPPLAFQKTTSVVTKILNKLYNKKPLIKYTAERTYKEHAEAITRYVQTLLESPYGINLYEKLWNIVFDAVSLGTEFVKIPFTIKRMLFNRQTESGSTERINKIIKASPDAIPLPMEDFITRSHWDDLNKAPWVGVRYYKFRHELEALAAQGFYTNVDQIITETGSLDEHKTTAQAMMGIEESGTGNEHNDLFVIYECNVFWDADGDGIAEDIIIHFEKNTKTLLRAEYNDLGIRDYIRIPHINIPGSLFGLGVGDIMLPLQDEAEALHNMRIDATQLAILPFVVTAESSPLGQSQNIYPGKVVKTPVPREDIIIHKFPSIGSEALQSESYIQQYADKASGASEALSGGDVGGYNRIGATGTQFLASQSLGYIDTIAEQMNKAIADMGMLFLYQLVKNSEYVDLSMLSDNDAKLVGEVLNMNVEDIPGKFKFQTRLSKAIDSHQAKQQQALQLFQVYTAYGDKMSQLAAQMANPQMAQVPRVVEAMQTYFVGLTNIMTNVLKNYDEDNVGDYLPFVKDLEVLLRQADEQRSQEVEQLETRTNSGENSNSPEQPIQPQQGGIGGPNNIEGAAGGVGQGPSEIPPGAPTVGGPAV